MTPPIILVIEDDPDGRRSVTEALEDAHYTVVACSCGEDGVRTFGERHIDAVLSDIRLPDIDGLQVLSRIRAINRDVPILLMTAYGTVETAVSALKSGAYDYILKPLDLTDLQTKVAHALETRRLRTEVTTLKQELHGRYSAKAIITASEKMRAVLRQIESVASTRATVLVLGESGTGKELVARALHYDSNRADAPFVAVNCGAFSETLLESELFGHEKGAFTGATNRHAGAFERANGGTLFLDEIGIAPLSVQARLLRVLETREVQRVGGTEPIAVDVRIVSASNRNLEDLIAEQLFRHDLLYRLQVVAIRVPPLRERPEDIRPLTDHFVTAACADHGRQIKEVAPESYARLERHPWPGNVRELRNVIETAVLLTPSARLMPGDLQLTERAPAAPSTALTIPPSVALADIEKQAILQSLQRHKGSRTLAADELGISTRTIQRKIRDYDLPF